jgi:hypothetical protein
MQNLANITAAEVAVAGSALLILSVAPTALAWSDAWRRRRALQVAAREAAAREAAAREAAAREAASCEAPVQALIIAGADLMAPQQPWEEPTVTVDAGVLGSPGSVVAGAGDEVVEAPAAAQTELPPAAEVREPRPAAEVREPVQIGELPEPALISEPPDLPPAEPVSEPPAPVEAPRFQFCLQELRRVRLPNWPPAEVRQDPARSEVWSEGERLAAQHQREIGAAALTSPHPAQASCFGSADADAASVRLRFLLFPVLWPSTDEQATAEAVFEINRADGTIRNWVNSRRTPS